MEQGKTSSGLARNGELVLARAVFGARDLPSPPDLDFLDPPNPHQLAAAAAVCTAVQRGPAGTAAAGAGLASGYGRSSWESAARQIPAGWRRLVDPGSGRPYYANLQTNATQWELPTAVHTGLAPRQWAATVSGPNT